VTRADHGVQRTLELRHHPAGKEFVAAERVLAVGPFVRAEHDATDAAFARRDHALDAAGDRLRRADERVARLDALAQRVLRSPGRAAQRLLEICNRLLTLAERHLPYSAFIVFGAVHVDDEAPVLAAH